MPWYAATLLLSQPLQFGDYGGMPLKVIWALLDIVTILVLGSGLYLWLSRRRRPVVPRIPALERDSGAALPPSAARHPRPHGSTEDPRAAKKGGTNGRLR